MRPSDSICIFQLIIAVFAADGAVIHNVDAHITCRNLYSCGLQECTRGFYRTLILYFKPPRKVGVVAEAVNASGFFVTDGSAPNPSV